SLAQLRRHPETLDGGKLFGHAVDIDAEPHRSLPDDQVAKTQYASYQPFPRRNPSSGPNPQPLTPRPSSPKVPLNPRQVLSVNPAEISPSAIRQCNKTALADRTSLRRTH